MVIKPSARTENIVTLAAPLAAAVVLGLAVVFNPLITTAAVVGIGLCAAMLARVEWAALAFVAIEPFSDYVNVVNPLAVKGVGAVLIVSWLLHLCAVKRPIRMPGAVASVAAALFVAILASTMLHSNGSAGLEILVRYVSFLAIFVILIDCVRLGLPAIRVARAYVVSCTGVAAVGIIGFMVSGNYRVGDPVVDPNDFAFYMVAALPLALALRRRSGRRWVYNLVIVVLLLALAGTLSRGAALGLVAMAVYAAVTGQVRIRFVVGTLVCAFLGSIVVLTLFADRVELSLAAKDQVAVENVDSRIVAWRAAAQMTTDSPVFGLGPAAFPTNYDRYIDRYAIDPSHELSVAHNMYLEVSAELGLFGLGAFLGLLFCGIGGSWRRWRAGVAVRPGGTGSADLDDVAVAGGVFAAFVGTLVAATFLSEQYYLPVWLLAALGVALDPGIRSRVRQSVNSHE